MIVAMPGLASGFLHPVIPAKETVQQTPAHQPTIEHFESGTGKKGFLWKAGG